MKKLMIFVACGIFSLVLSSHAHAASFEDMTSHVESGDGLIYNPESKGVMTKENSIEYVKIVKDKLSNTAGDLDNKLDDILEETNIETKDLEVLPASEQKENPPILLRGSQEPTTLFYLDGIIYTSNLFSGSGWRYSGYKFAFHDYNKNKYYGVKATKDSFNFFIVIGAPVAVPANGNYVYYPSKGLSVINPYFSTYNPVSGSQYYIQ